MLTYLNKKVYTIANVFGVLWRDYFLYSLSVVSDLCIISDKVASRNTISGKFKFVILWRKGAGSLYLFIIIDYPRSLIN